MHSICRWRSWKKPFFIAKHAILTYLSSMNLFIMFNISSRISKYSILFVMKLQKFVTMFFLPLAFLFSTSLKRKHDLQLELNEDEEMIRPFPPKTKQKNLTTLYLATPPQKKKTLIIWVHVGSCHWLSGTKYVVVYCVIYWLVGGAYHSIFLKIYNEPLWLVHHKLVLKLWKLTKI